MDIFHGDGDDDNSDISRGGPQRDRIYKRHAVVPRPDSE